ncbi:MAG: hypothetical protein ACKOEZ_08060, partial [Spartobacteria bacterium]
TAMASTDTAIRAIQTIPARRCRFTDLTYGSDFQTQAAVRGILAEQQSGRAIVPHEPKILDPCIFKQSHCGL